MGGGLRAVARLRPDSHADAAEPVLGVNRINPNPNPKGLTRVRGGCGGGGGAPRDVQARPVAAGGCPVRGARLGSRGLKVPCMPM